MTLSKLSVSSSGWVNNITHHVSPNERSGMSVPKDVNGVVMHTMVGNLPGTDQEFENRAAQVSAHFGVGQDGTIIQWVNIKGGIAWAEASGNDHWYSIEFADDGNPNNPLTQAQINSGARLVELLSRVGNFPLQETNSVNGEGLGVHNMGGGGWGGHTCPDLPPKHVRSSQRGAILALAKEIRSGTAAPTVTVKYWTCQGQDSLDKLCKTQLKNEVSTVLRLSAEHASHAQFSPAVADYVNGVFKLDAANHGDDKVPAGVMLYLGDKRGWYKSTGHQNLQGLANDCGYAPATILRLTVEKSAVQIFAGDLSAHINNVFARNTPKVPKGTVLYYQV